MGKELNRQPNCCRKCKIGNDGANCNGCTRPNKSKTHFICEICGCITPRLCEGSEPNTCVMCMPLDYEEK